MSISRNCLFAASLWLGAAIGVAAQPGVGPDRLALAEPAGRMPVLPPARLAQTKTPPQEAVAQEMLVRYHEPAAIARLPAAAGDRDWRCLAEALYFEARGEPLKGQFAVAEVILNRAESPRYPRSICGVVHQRNGGSCQFSYTCDGGAGVIRERAAFVVAGKVARLMLDGAPRTLTDGATHFHSRAVRPGWSQRLPRTAAIGHHLFYRETGGS